MSKVENIFFFAGFDAQWRERVKKINDSKEHLLVDGCLYDMDENYKPLSKEQELTEKFENGFYLGCGSMGNGTVYWNKREQEHGDYKIIGQITSSNELIIRTEDATLVQFLRKQHKGGK